MVSVYVRIIVFPGISPTTTPPPVPQRHQSPCWMTDLKYSYLVLNNQTSQPPSKKTKARTRGITPHQNHTCVRCIIQDVVIEVMNCAYAVHLLIVVNIFKPFLQALVDSRENRAG